MALGRQTVGDKMRIASLSPWAGPVRKAADLKNRSALPTDSWVLLFLPRALHSKGNATDSDL